MTYTTVKYQWPATVNGAPVRRCACGSIHFNETDLGFFASRLVEDLYAQGITLHQMRDYFNAAIDGKAASERLKATA